MSFVCSFLRVIYSGPQTLTLEMKQKQCVLSADFQQFMPSQIKYWIYLTKSPPHPFCRFTTVCTLKTTHPSKYIYMCPDTFLLIQALPQLQIKYSQVKSLGKHSYPHLVVLKQREAGKKLSCCLLFQTNISDWPLTHVSGASKNRGPISMGAPLSAGLHPAFLGHSRAPFLCPATPLRM